jgi:hypothetical protein
MTPEDFTKFLTGFMSLASEYSNDGSLHYVFIDWKHLSEMLAAGDIAYSELKNIVVGASQMPEWVASTVHSMS